MNKNVESSLLHIIAQLERFKMANPQRTLLNHVIVEQNLLINLVPVFVDLRLMGVAPSDLHHPQDLLDPPHVRHQEHL